MNIYLFGRPIFVWFGVLAMLLLFVTAFFGIKMKKYGLKTHKIAAAITILFALLHLIFGGARWIF